MEPHSAYVYDCPVCQVQKTPVQKTEHPHLEHLTKQEILRKYPDRILMAEAFAKALWAKEHG